MFTGSFVLGGEINSLISGKFNYSFDIEPVALGRPRFTKSGHCFTPTKSRAFKDEIRRLFLSQANHMALEGPMYVEMIFTFKKPKSNKKIFHTQKPDSSNLAKGVEDALNGYLWKDDSQIIGLMILKRWGEKSGIDLNVYTF